MGEALITRRGGGGSGKKTIQGSVTNGGSSGITVTFPLSGLSTGAYATEIQWRRADGYEYRMSPVINIKGASSVEVLAHGGANAIGALSQNHNWDTVLGAVQIASVSVSYPSGSVALTWNYFASGGVTLGKAEMWKIEPLS